MNNSIELIIRSPYRFSTTVYLSHKLMRQFYGNKDYMKVLKNMMLPSDYSFRIKTAENYKSYKCDSTISSLLLLELLIVSDSFDDDVCSNIRDYILSDKLLDRYSFNRNLSSIRDIEFTISCKSDYLSFVSQKMINSVKNVIARQSFFNEQTGGELMYG